MAFIACKLPHGLTINHQGQTINLNGPNEDNDPLNPNKNGQIVDSGTASGGFGLTELDGDKLKAFDDWVLRVTHVDGDKTKPKLAEPFLPLVNGSIQRFANEKDARAETQAMSSAVRTGLEGVDPEKDLPSGLETDKDAMRKAGK